MGTTHTFYVDIYNKDVENVVKAERIPTPEETTELPLVPGATISQKKEAEFSSPVGIVPTPADILQEPIEGKDDSQTFGADLYVKDNLEETSKIDQQLENVLIGLPSYKERISEDISDFPEPGEMGGKDKLKKKDIPAPDTLSCTVQSSLTRMDIKPPKDAAVAVFDIPKDPYNTEDLTVKSVETVEYLPEESTQAFPIPTPGVLEPDTPTDAKASSLFTDVVYELQTSSSNISEKIISEEHVVLPPIPMSLPQDMLQAVEQHQVVHGVLPDPLDKMQEPKSSVVIQEPQYLQKEMYASLVKQEESKFISGEEEEEGVPFKLPEYSQPKKVTDSPFPVMEQIPSNETLEENLDKRKMTLNISQEPFPKPSLAVGASPVDTHTSV